MGFLAAPETRYTDEAKYAKELEDAIRLNCKLRDRFNDGVHKRKFGGPLQFGRERGEESPSGMFARRRDGSIEALDASVCRTGASSHLPIGGGRRAGSGGGGREDECCVPCGGGRTGKGCEVM